MSAEMLRAAAALMRERAEAAMPGPWVSGNAEWSSASMVFEDAKVNPDFVDEDEAANYCVAQTMNGYTSDADAEYIASWHPAVALAVADWLEKSANFPLVPCERETCLDCDPYKAALAVAAAYLGTAS